VLASWPGTGLPVVDRARVFMAVTEGASAPTSHTGSAGVPKARGTQAGPHVWARPQQMSGCGPVSRTGRRESPRPRP
jgi:hypothetical protein